MFSVSLTNASTGALSDRRTTAVVPIAWARPKGSRTCKSIPGAEMTTPGTGMLQPCSVVVSSELHAIAMTMIAQPTIQERIPTTSPFLCPARQTAARDRTSLLHRRVAQRQATGDKARAVVAQYLDFEDSSVAGPHGEEMPIRL